MLLANKRILVTGALTESSIAFHAARLAQQQGAHVVLTGFGRGLRITELIAEKLPEPVDVLELDVTVPEHLATVAETLEQRWGGLDGVLHAIAYAPPTALGGFLQTPWPDVATTLQISTYSFSAFGRAFGPLLAKAGGGSLVGLDFDASRAWPNYDWMGVAKAALESCCRYLARELGRTGTRVNLVAAGPLRTMAAKAIPGFSELERHWLGSPLPWDTSDPEPVARVICALLSDWFPAVTGAIVPVDGGLHAVAAEQTWH
jgi:enoyl-[acyl-carrier protein] reductase I